MTMYRIYEAIANEAGGLDPVGTGWEYIEAATAAEAAAEAASVRGGVAGCDDIMIVATDDDGESATIAVADYLPAD